MGRAISHRTLIVHQWLQGKEYSQISQNTFHSVLSVKNYISKFKRVIALAQEGFDIHGISFLVKISVPLWQSNIIRFIKPLRWLAIASENSNRF